MSARAVLTLYILAWTCVLLLGATFLEIKERPSPLLHGKGYRVQHINWSE